MTCHRESRRLYRRLCAKGARRLHEGRMSGLTFPELIAGAADGIFDHQDLDVTRTAPKYL